MPAAETKKITIEVTEAQEKFLKAFNKNHHPGAEQNLGTYCPIHLVQTRKERVVDSDYNDYDTISYYDQDSCESYDSVEDLVRAHLDSLDIIYDKSDLDPEDEDAKVDVELYTYDEAYKKDHIIGVDGEEHVIADDDDYITAYGLDHTKVNKCFAEYYYETVAYFFILEEAKNYMNEYQRHNLCHPRTYTVSPGYANYGEFVPFWNLLNSIGEQLNTKDKLEAKES